MIFNVPAATYLQIMELFHLMYIYIRQLRSGRKSINMFQEMMQIMNSSLPMLLPCISVIILYCRYLKMKSTKRKRLWKPHMLLRILAGYRANEQTHDVWRLLESNWTHFFWLTGETPVTLQGLVDALENHYYPYIYRGHRTLLDFHNQVHTTAHLNSCTVFQSTMILSCTYIMVMH